MNLAIVGSRDYPNLNEVVEYVNSLPLDTVIVTGGARGVDDAAQFAAEARGMKVIVFKADWEKYGKAAGPIRNLEIEKNSNAVTAFWDLKSRGTLDCISNFRKSGKTVEIKVPNP